MKTPLCYYCIVILLVVDPEAVDPEDVEMLQDMIVAAVNEAMRSADADAPKSAMPWILLGLLVAVAAVAYFMLK